MIHINLDEIKHNLPACLEHAEFGETFIVTRDGRPIFELRHIGKKAAEPRPFGLCKGEFHVPDDFDAPLPEHILDAFEGK
ncbi:MAG TPA: type II toxin-antitoxin system Phd/YefM family antitoxin [Desulfobacterales bacterium]|nr:MAG: type II toxin-antitoxin system Phd/YefM family antitoxin [Deltaproteobacteria bacterium]HHC24332.1 type II toxin-antitoxin system Phd/YefM family antitoxin [Desulfobacterales bacterium]